MKKILSGDEILIIYTLIGGSSLGIDINNVVSIIEPKSARTVPLAPTYINSIINYYGKIITLFDLKKYLNLNTGEASEEQKVIYLKHSALNIGLVVDKIEKIDYISTSMAEPLTDNEMGVTMANLCSSFFIIKENEPGIFWLDTERVEKVVEGFDFSDL